MATTETVASDHTSATDEQIVKKEKSEAIAEMIASLANEDEVKHDKPENAAHADGGHTIPSSMVEGDETKGELGVVKVEKTDDSPALEASAEDNLKHDKIEDAQTPATPFSKTEEDDKKAKPALVVEKTDDPVSLEEHIADNLKEEKESLPDSHTTSDASKSHPEEPLFTEPTVKETTQQLEKEPIETEEEKQPKTVDIPETSAETIGKSINTAEANPHTESEAEVVKEAKILETSPQKEEKPEPEPEPEPVAVAVAVAVAVQEETQEPEKESQEKPQEGEQPSTVTIPEPSIEANAIEEKTREPSAEILKETNDYEAGPTESDKAEPVVAEVEENPKETEKQSLEQKEEEQPDTVAIPQVPSAETIEVKEEKTREPEVLEETKNYEAGHTEAEKAEPVITKDHETPSEPVKQSFKHEEEEVPKTVIPETEGDVIPQVPSAETSEVLVEKTREPEVLEDTKNYEAEATESEKAEPAITKVDENPSEPEKQSFKQEEEELPKTVIPETEGGVIPQVPSAETSKVIEEKTIEPEVLEETKNYNAGPTEAEKAEPVITKVDETPSEPEKQSLKQEEEELPKTVIPETEGDAVEVHPPKVSDIEVVKEIDDSESKAVPGKAEKPGDVVVVHPPIESDIELVKETGTSELEAVPGKEEKPEPVSTEVEEKPRELLEVAEEVAKTSTDVETKQEIVLETTKIEETSDDPIKDPISLKEEKTNKGEEASITAKTAQVSLNEEVQAAPKNLVEPSEVAAKVVEEDGKKESSFTNVIEGVSKDEAEVLKTSEQDSIDQEAITDLKEEREYPVPTSVEEKVAVAVAANDDKKEPEKPEAVQVSSREAEFEIKKDEEQIEAKTATTEAEVLKVENVKDNGPAIDNEKGHTDTKVDEISSAVSDPVRETLASKFEEEEATKTGVDNSEKEQTEEPVKTEVQVPEPPTKESDAIKTSSKDLPKETPAKPAQKQSNNIISKVKQSLVKAKKAITGKSPSSKNLSSEAKDDIKVK